MNTSIFSKCLCGLFSLLLWISFVGYVCKVSEANFDKIQTGMTVQETIHILGQPTRFEKVLGKGEQTLAIWRHPNVMITLKFVYDHLIMKDFIKDRELSEFIGDDDFIKQNDKDHVENKNGGYMKRAYKKPASISAMK
jgi:hypothetical protein